MERNLLIVKSLGLIKHCPAGKPQEGCPFSKISACFSLRDSFRYIKTLSDHDIIQLLGQHMECFNLRLDSCQDDLVKEYFHIS